MASTALQLLYEEEEKEEKQEEEKKSWRAANRKKIPAGHFAQNIKCTLNTLCGNGHLRKYLNGAVDIMTVVGIWASRLANLHMLRACASNGEISIGKLDQTFMRRCCVLVLGKIEGTSAKNDADLRATYKRFMRDDMKGALSILPAKKRGDLDAILMYTAVQMSANIRTGIKTQFLRRHRLWCKGLANAVVPDVQGMPEQQAKERRALRYQIINFVFGQTAIADPKKPSTLEAQIDILKTKCATVWGETLEATVRHEIEVFYEDVSKDARPITYHKLLHKDKSHWYIKRLHRMLRDIEAHNKECETDKSKKMIKTFSLLPIRGFDRCYINFSSDGLHRYIHANQDNVDVKEALGEGVVWRDVVKAKPLFNERENEFWRYFFNIGTLLHENKVPTPKVTFYRSISTDGVGASVFCIKKGVQASKQVDDENNHSPIQLEEGEETQRIRVPRGIDESTVVSASDPGKRAVHTTVQRVEGEAKEQVQSYSGKRWLHECGANDANRKRALWTKRQEAKYPGFQKWLTNDMPSCKVATVEAMRKHNQHLGQEARFAQLMEMNGVRKVRQLKFRNHTKRQRALAEMCLEFFGGESNRQHQIRTKTRPPRPGKLRRLREWQERQRAFIESREAVPMQVDDDGEEVRVLGGCLIRMKLLQEDTPVQRPPQKEPVPDARPITAQIKNQHASLPQEMAVEVSEETQELVAMLEDAWQQKRRIDFTKKRVVVFGNARFGCTGPVQTFQKRLKEYPNVEFVSMNEYYTSQLPSCCAFNELYDAIPHNDLLVYPPKQTKSKEKSDDDEEDEEQKDANSWLSFVSFFCFLLTLRRESTEYAYAQYVVKSGTEM